MKEYKLSDLTPGISEQFDVVVTKEMQDTFRDLTGDLNPMHIDCEYAISNGYNDIIIFGMLTSSFYSTLAGCWLPGKYCVLQETNISFASPAYIGDILTVSGTVTTVYEELKRVRIKVRITDQNGKTISRGNIVTGVLK